MIIKIKVKTKAKENRIEKIPEEKNSADSGSSFKHNPNIQTYLVSVKALPVKNKANQEIFKILAEHFNVPKSNIKILRGEKNNQKTFEITN